MRHLFTLFATIALVLSLGMGPAVHAMEPVGCVDAATTLLSHADGDADQVPADSEKGYPHHHGGCQGHQIATAVGAPASFEAYVPGVLRAIEHVAAVRGLATDPGLRPPQA